MLIEGKFVADTHLPRAEDGAHQRTESKFRSWVTPDGSAGPTGDAGFAAAPGRYHLYAFVGCPWAHRTLIFRALKNLEDVVGVSFVQRMGPEGWVLGGDEVLGKENLHEVYTTADPDFTGRVTVPVLWDRERRTIVSNESSEIIRMFDHAFDAFTDVTSDHYPEALQAEIDSVNADVYQNVNDGVYRAGFAGTQEVYERAVDDVFGALDRLEDRLATRRYLAGDVITEADWRLFPTLIRFDVAYHSAFRCNVRRLVDYPNLWAFTKALYQTPKVADTVDLDLYRRGYHSIPFIERSIIARGPTLDLDAPHGR